MSRIIGTGLDACLVAGGFDAPDRVSRRAAVAHLLTGHWLYGHKELGRGWIGKIADALEELDPEAKAHWDEHEDPLLTRKLFCDHPDDQVGDP